MSDQSPTDQPPAASGTPGVCENCTRDDDDLVPVKRLYVQPETWDQPGKITPTDDVEQWCYSCRTQYPHEEIGASPP